jgi:hypothetical protein
MDMRDETWNVRSLYRSGALKTVSRELAEYKLDLVAVQEVTWDKGGTEPATHSELLQLLRTVHSVFENTF